VPAEIVEGVQHPRGAGQLLPRPRSWCPSRCIARQRLCSATDAHAAEQTDSGGQRTHDEGFPQWPLRACTAKL